MIARTLIVVGLALALPVALGTIAALIALNDRANDHDAEPLEGEPVEHHGWDDDTTVLDSIVDETRAELAAAAAEVPAELAPRTLAPNWADLVEAPEVPQLAVEPEERRGRHYHDTVEIVPASHRLPEEVARRIALATDTQQFAAVTA